MAPSEKVLSDTIRNAVRRMFKGPERDNLTVNKVREYVELELHLEGGFLKQGLWKQESKNLVKNEIDKIEQLEESGDEPPSIQSTPAQTKAVTSTKPEPEPIKKGVKRSSNDDREKGQKRQKKSAAAISDDEDADSALTSIEDTPEEPEDSFLVDTPEPKKSKKTAVKPNAMGPGKEKAKEGNHKHKQEVDIGQKPKISSSKPSEKKSASGNVQSDGISKEDNSMDANDADLQSESEMSVVLDEAPKSKTKSKSAIRGESSNSTSKSSKTPNATKHPPDLSPDDAELKTLQSQLTMCGVRKIWGVILKDYGSDTKAKIRHLKGMLRDIGMEGRFSKQKAQEIKEARELQEDLEAVKEGNKKWGLERSSRSKNPPKSLAEPTDEEEEDEDVGGKGRSLSEQLPARVAKAKMDLAFLGDESESDD